jgi:cytochrome oxidase Cu insertion factor (SCO1/SenC/PrrC family)
MKSFPWLAIALVVLVTSSQLSVAQERQRDEAQFVKERPAVGETVPDVTVYDIQGQPLKTSSLRGHYSVLTFGCLT